MAQFIRGDIFSKRFRNPETCIIHQCNCITIIPYGLSKSIVKQFGEYANSYGRRLRLSRNIAAVRNRPRPGTIEFCKDRQILLHCLPNSCLVNLHDGIRIIFDNHIKKGIRKDTKKHRLLYFKQALANLSDFLVNSEINTIVFPKVLL